jgi:hypothetical protein
LELHKRNNLRFSILYDAQNLEILHIWKYISKTIRDGGNLSTKYYQKLSAQSKQRKNASKLDEK